METPVLSRPNADKRRRSVPAHRIFCNRTMNLHRIGAIGYDMDYTLIHYQMRAWEERAYTYVQERLAAQGWPVAGLSFQPELVMRGLIIDAELGNVVKADRFGYVKRAFHGARPIAFAEQRRAYDRVLIDLRDPRWVFLTTLFSISEACLFMQLVDLLDRGELPPALGYDDLIQVVRRSIDEAHMEGHLKAEIIASPEAFVEPNAEIPLALLDQKMAGKKILLITNSEWSYAAPMLSYAFDPFLPEGITWKDLFDIALVGARKPDFFSVRMPAFEVVTPEGLLREHFGPLETGKVYVGGNAALVEASLGLGGEEILYVGDHIAADVEVSKSMLRWRTALILRELEDDLRAVADFAPREREIEDLMRQKTRLETEYTAARLKLLRIRRRYGPAADVSPKKLERRMQNLRERITALDERIAPIAEESGRLHNANWGLLMRTGNDKSYLARQVETFADIYMAGVGDMLHHTPFAYFRSHRGSLPHDPS